MGSGRWRKPRLVSSTRPADSSNHSQGGGLRPLILFLRGYSMEITSQTAHSFQLSAFRDHCRIPWTDDNSALQRSLDAGVSMWEKVTNWYTRATTIEIAILPGMQVPFGPAAAISSVTKYKDGVSQGAVTSDWYLANVWGSREWRLTASGSWDTRCEYRASMTVAGSVTPDVKVGVFDLGNHLYRDREGVSPLSLNSVPLSLRTLIQNHQLGGM